MSDKSVRWLQSTWGLSKYHLAMLALVKWSNAACGTADRFPACWYDATSRWIQCRICGEKLRARRGLDQWFWIEKHERIHVARVGVEKVKAFMCLLDLRNEDKPMAKPVVESVLGYRDFDLTAIIEAGREVFG